MANDGDDRTLKKAKWAPYLLSFPGMLCIYLFFVVPLVTLTKIALSIRGTGVEQGRLRLAVGQLLEGVHRLR